MERHLSGATVLTSKQGTPQRLGQLAAPLLAQPAIDRLQSGAYNSSSKEVLPAPPTANHQPEEEATGWAKACRGETSKDNSSNLRAVSSLIAATAAPLTSGISIPSNPAWSALADV